MKDKTVLVIGGGPAGMMAATTAAENYNVILLEKNDKLGKKMFITGKGRCNITNARDISEFFDMVQSNPSFMYSSFYTFTNEDTQRFFKSLGVELKVERGDRIFPVSDKSSDFISAFSKELNNRGVKVMLNSIVKELITEENKIKAVKLSNSDIITFDYIIIATGGLSYPQTGSTGDGYIFSRALGHNIVNPKPSLVPIETKEHWVSELQGLSLKNVELTVKTTNGKTVYKDLGEMLFTHYGMSGPLILRSSAKIVDDKDYKIIINLKPALTREELDKRIQKDFQKFINKDFKNSLNELLPQKLIPTIITLSSIDENKKVNLITKEERKKLCEVIQEFTFNFKKLRPIAEAIITSGGVDVKQIDASTMKSKLIDNLYFAGEVMDLDALTGGFNMQIALSTGYLAGKEVGN